MYLEHDELEREFSFEGATQVKIYFYFYTIVGAGASHPYIKTYMNVSGDAATFPTIEITPAAEEADEILNDCIERAVEAGIIKNTSFISQYREHYRGLIRPEGLGQAHVLVFEIDDIGEAPLMPAILDEIVNLGKIQNATVEKWVVDFFIEKPRLLYLMKENMENYEIPQVMWSAGGGDTVRTAGEYGYFYYFSGAPPPVENAKKYAGFVEKTYFIGGGGDTSAVDINKEFDAAVICSGSNKWVYKCPMFFDKI